MILAISPTDDRVYGSLRCCECSTTCALEMVVLVSMEIIFEDAHSPSYSHHHDLLQVHVVLQHLEMPQQ